MCHFLAQNGPFDMNKKIFGTNHYYYFHLPIGPFHCAKFFKNSYSESRVLRMSHFWAQNGPFAPNKNLFFEKLLQSFSSTYCPLSFCKILKKFLVPVQTSYEDMPFLRPKYPNFSCKNFFGTNHCHYFHLPIGPFVYLHCEKFF